MERGPDAGCDGVAHCAGINREIGSQTYEHVHAQGTRNVVNAARLAGVRGHETIWLPPSHIRRIGPLRITSPARTLIDTCGMIPFDALKKSANNAMRRGILTPMDLARCIDEVPVSGRRKRKPALGLVARNHHASDERARH